MRLDGGGEGGGGEWEGWGGNEPSLQAANGTNSITGSTLSQELHTVPSSD